MKSKIIKTVLVILTISIAGISCQSGEIEMGTEFVNIPGPSTGNVPTQEPAKASIVSYCDALQFIPEDVDFVATVSFAQFLESVFFKQIEEGPTIGGINFIPYTELNDDEKDKFKTEYSSLIQFYHGDTLDATDSRAIEALYTIKTEITERVLEKIESFSKSLSEQENIPTALRMTECIAFGVRLQKADVSGQSPLDILGGIPIDYIMVAKGDYKSNEDLEEMRIFFNKINKKETIKKEDYADYEGICDYPADSQEFSGCPDSCKKESLFFTETTPTENGSKTSYFSHKDKDDKVTLLGNLGESAIFYGTENISQDAMTMFKGEKALDAKGIELKSIQNSLALWEFFKQLPLGTVSFAIKTFEDSDKIQQQEDYYELYVKPMIDIHGLGFDKGVYAGMSISTSGDQVGVTARISAQEDPTTFDLDSRTYLSPRIMEKMNIINIIGKIMVDSDFDELNDSIKTEVEASEPRPWQQILEDMEESHAECSDI